MDDFTKYALLREKGSSAHQAYLIAKSDGLDFAACIRMLRSVYEVPFMDAKEITVQADGLGTSLDDYQEKLIPGLKKILEETDEEDSQD